MAKLAVLVPSINLFDKAESLFEYYTQITRHSVDYVDNTMAVERAKLRESEGCDVIMARGLQARMIRDAVKIPVVEIRVTAQELGAVILELKNDLCLKTPKIALIGSNNMLCDTTQFDRLFDIKLLTYRIEPDANAEEVLHQSVDDAVENGCHGIIGGHVACSYAEARRIPYRFIYSGLESLQTAFDLAEHICHAIDLEKLNRAEMETMFNFTQNGLLSADKNGYIQRANAMAGHLLSMDLTKVAGASLSSIIPGLRPDMLEKVLCKGEEAYTVLIPPNRKELAVNISPIQVDDRINGCVLTIQEGRRILELSSELRHELFLQGHVARWHFSELPAHSEEIRKMLARGKRISNYREPVLITGESGSGKEILAQCIHNESVAKGNAFISLDCRAYHADNLDTLLFGNYTSRKDTSPCITEKAENGTLFLQNVDALSAELQYKLMQLIRGVFFHNGSNRSTKANVRIIASSEKHLMPLLETGAFRNDLYYALNALGITTTPIRHCKEELPYWIELYLMQWQKRYNRPVNLTQGAKTFLFSYDWPGNLYQIESVCEQIVLLSDKRNINENFLRQEILHLAPTFLPGTDQAVVYKDERAVYIATLLREYDGNRQKVAKILGISTTTLWRRMKKYGIGSDFSY